MFTKGQVSFFFCIFSSVGDQKCFLWIETLVHFIDWVSSSWEGCGFAHAFGVGSTPFVWAGPFNGPKPIV